MRLLQNFPSLTKTLSTFPRTIKLVLAVCILTAVTCLSALAQTTTSSIFGTISDPAGAVIPNARVVAVNTATGVHYAAITDSTGGFRITQLPPGPYTLEASSSGFATKQTTPFTLFVAQALQQNLSLATGVATETVSVAASALLLNTQNSSEGQIVENQQIEQLPLNGRDFIQLTSLTAGVTPVVSGISSSANQWTTGVAPSTGGSQTAAVDIAGTREDDVSYLYDGIETRNAWYGAEGLLPSVDNIQEFRVEQSGMSAATGDGAAFINIVTRSGTNTLHGTAYEFLRNNDLDARNYFDVGAPPAFHQNQFGGSVGGPIKKSKLFFFLNYEGFRQIAPSDLYNLVPTAAQRAGNFSADKNQLYDPYTGAPFAGNIIPAADFNALGVKILSFYPLPNGSFLNGADNYFNVADTINNWNQENGRIDWNPRDKDALFVRMTLQSQALTEQNITPYRTSVYPSDPKNLAVGWTHTFSANLVNNLRWGWSHTSTGENRADAYDTALANPIGFIGEEDQAGSDGPPSFGITGYANPGSTEGTDIMREGLIMTTDDLTMQRGKHIMSVGADVRYEPTYFYEDWAATSVDFNGIYTGDTVATGDPIADVLVGVPDYAQTAFGNPTLNFRRWYMGYYAQDDWRITPTLTLNAGIRWDHHTQPTDTANHVGTFDFATDQDLTYPATNALGLGRAMVHGDYTDWEPRLGFNWVPFGDSKTDIKGGAGVYFTQANMNQYEVEVDTTQYYLVDAFSNSPVGTTPPSFSLNQLFTTTTPGSAPTVSFINPNNRDPYVFEYNLAVDHTIGPWLFEVSYIGSNSHRVEVRSNLNPVQPDGKTIVPQWNGIQENLDAGNSDYNAVFGRIVRQFRNGFSLTAAYTYSKCFSDPWQDEFDWHPLDLKLDWGHCAYSLDQNFTANAVYQLPFGKGRQFMNQGGWSDAVLGGWEVSGIASALSGAWLTLGGAGQNLGLFVNSLPNVTGPVNHTSLFSGIGKNGKIGPLFNTANVTPETATGVQGNASVQNIASPGWQDYDVSADKSWKVQQYQLTFRGDFFNVFNHPQFTGLDTGVDDATFGDVTSANAAREIQLSLRFAF